MRFPEFQGEWEWYSIEKIANLSKGSGISKDQLSENGHPCILYGELYTKYKSEIIQEILSKTDIASNSLVKSVANDVIIPSSGESAIDIATARCVPFSNILLGGDLNIIRLKRDNGSFLSYQLNGVRKYDIAKVAQGVSVVHLYGESLKKIQVSICSEKEQEKIANFLSLLDERIATQNKIIEKLESLIRGIYFAAKRDNWEMQFLKDILEERDEQNSCNCPVYSVAVREGVINQIEHLGRSFAAKDTRNYNVVYYGDIVYTKSPTGSFPYGIVKQSFVNHPVAVSPLYGVYKPKNPHIANILHYYFLSPINANNYLHSLIQKGAKNTINITSQRFLDKTILLPTNKMEIKNISLLLGIISKKNQIEKDVQKKLYTQKAFLLQQMFI